MITYLELEITGGVSVSLVSPRPWRSGDWHWTLGTLHATFCIVVIRCTETFWSPCVFTLWRLDPIAGLGLPLQGFAIAFIGHPVLDGILLTSEKPVAETSVWQHTILTRDTSIPPGGIRTRNPSTRAAEYIRVRPHGQWDRLWKTQNP
jgi:hypothetical protein